MWNVENEEERGKRGEWKTRSVESVARGKCGVWKMRSESGKCYKKNLFLIHINKNRSIRRETENEQKPRTRDTDQVWRPFLFTSKNGFLYTPFVSR